MYYCIYFEKISEILSQLNSIKTNIYLFLLSLFLSGYEKYLNHFSIWY